MVKMSKEQLLPGCAKLKAGCILSHTQSQHLSNTFHDQRTLQRFGGTGDGKEAASKDVGKT